MGETGELDPYRCLFSGRHAVRMEAGPPDILIGCARAASFTGVRGVAPELSLVRVQRERPESDAAGQIRGRTVSTRPTAIFRIFHRFPQDFRRSLHLHLHAGNNRRTSKMQRF